METDGEEKVRMGAEFPNTAQSASLKLPFLCPVWTQDCQCYVTLGPPEQHRFIDVLTLKYSMTNILSRLFCHTEIAQNKHTPNFTHRFQVLESDMSQGKLCPYHLPLIRPQVLSQFSKPEDAQYAALSQVCFLEHLNTVKYIACDLISAVLAHRNVRYFCEGFTGPTLCVISYLTRSLFLYSSMLLCRTAITVKQSRKKKMSSL